jgi:hypothetical protein
MRKLMSWPLLLAAPLAGLVRAAEEANYPFASRLDDARYQVVVATLPQKRIDPAAVAASPFPNWGLRVVRVTPGSQADQMGMKAESVISKLNGTEYYHHKAGLRPDKDGKRVVTVVSAEGEVRDYDFKAGVVGTRAGNDYRYEQYLYQNTPRGKWDRDLLVAAVAWQQGNHPLAEDALARATAAGLPASVFTRFYGGLLALDRGQPDLSRRLTAAVVKELPADPAKISRFFHPGLATLGLAFQDFSLLEPGAIDRAGLDSEIQAATIKPWKAWSKSGPRPSLLKQALAGAGEEKIPSIIKERAEWANDHAKLDLDPLRRDGFAISIPTGHYDMHVFTPPEPIRDAIWEIHFALADGGDLKPVGVESMNTLRFAMLDRAGDASRRPSTTGGLENRMIAGLTYDRQRNNERLVKITGGPAGGEVVDTQVFLPVLGAKEFEALKARGGPGKRRLEPDDPRLAKLTFIRIGNEVEVLSGSRPILHLPIDPKVKDLAFYIFSQGTNYIVDHMSLRPISAVDLNLAPGE